MTQPVKVARILATPIFVLLAGCSTYSVSRYSVSTDNIMAMKTLKGETANVGSFVSVTPEQTEIGCRGVGPIKTPDGESFSAYIRKALSDEMKLAEIYNDKSSVTLTGTLDHIDFSSTSGEWDIALQINSSNGMSAKAVEKYKFQSSFYGETACNQTAQAFVPAVQDLVGKIIRDPAFPRLLKK